MTHKEFSKKGGLVKSKVKAKSGRENLKKAREELARRRKSGALTGSAHQK